MEWGGNYSCKSARGAIDVTSSLLLPLLGRNIFNYFYRGLTARFLFRSGGWRPSKTFLPRPLLVSRCLVVTSHVMQTATHTVYVVINDIGCGKNFGSDLDLQEFVFWIEHYILGDFRNQVS